MQENSCCRASGMRSRGSRIALATASHLNCEHCMINFLMPRHAFSFASVCAGTRPLCTEMPTGGTCSSPRDGRHDVWLFDWDASRLDLGVSDLAHMMTVHRYPDLRRGSGALLERYRCAHVVNATACRPLPVPKFAALGERAIRPDPLRLQRPQSPSRLLMPDDNWRLAPRYYAASGGDDRSRR
jgi:hypothetical protein